VRSRVQLFAWLVLAAAGVCAAKDPGVPAPGVVAATAATTRELPWPARLPLESGLKLRADDRGVTRRQVMGTIEPVQPPIMAVHLGSRDNAAVAKARDDDWRIVQSRLRGGSAGLKPVFEKPGGFLYVSADAEPSGAASGRAAIMFRFISARQSAGEAGGGGEVTIERTWFALYDPLPLRTEPGDPPAEARAARGLVVVLPGMFGTPVDQIVGLVKKLRQEGYCVLRMMSQPSRFTESVTYALPLDGDASGAMPRIAADLADRAAEAAYAVEAAVQYAEQERPALARLPRAAVGMSGGAMLLPIVLSRNPSEWVGAVSIAGGVDYLRILSTSNYANWIDAVRVKWTGAAPEGARSGEPVAPTAARLEEIARAYRLAAPLDSVNLVPALRSLPWLLLHATADRAVPAATGEEMWELLGRPERINVKGGHELIFLTLGGRHRAIAEWLDKRMSVGREPSR